MHTLLLSPAFFVGDNSERWLGAVGPWHGHQRVSSKYESTALLDSMLEGILVGHRVRPGLLDCDSDGGAVAVATWRGAWHMRERERGREIRRASMEYAPHKYQARARRGSRYNNSAGLMDSRAREKGSEDLRGTQNQPEQGLDAVGTSHNNSSSPAALPALQAREH